MEPNTATTNTAASLLAVAPVALTLPAPLGAWAMARNLLEVKSKASKLAGILCNIEDKEEGVKGSENSDNENHMVWRNIQKHLERKATAFLMHHPALFKYLLTDPV